MFSERKYGRGRKQTGTEKVERETRERKEREQRERESREKANRESREKAFLSVSLSLCLCLSLSLDVRFCVVSVCVDLAFAKCLVL